MAAPHLATEVITRDHEQEQRVVQTAELVVTRGPDRGKRCEICERTVTVGSDPDCDLVLSDNAVSRHQFEVHVDPVGFVLRDLESTNGTFVGKLRVREVVLASGTKVSAGRTELRFAELSRHETFPLSRHQSFGQLLGRAPAMRSCFTLLEAAASSDSTLLIDGESGTGKELAAESVHQQSGRAAEPFVVVDCGAIPANLMESELFGHVKGAFTGATAARTGAFEAADRGTLFLDEVGELDLGLQPKLLRFLERREVQQVGSTNRHPVDVRVIAATNRRLENMVQESLFRQDLYYRLAVLQVRMPALRERREDVPLLALELARSLRPDLDPMSWLDDHTLGILAGHSWPGNVRELRNTVERLAVLPLERIDLGSDLTPGAATDPQGDAAVSVDLAYHEAKQRVVDRFERQYLTALLEQEQGVVVRAAERAQVPRQTLFRLIRKHGLREPTHD